MFPWHPSIELFLLCEGDSVDDDNLNGFSTTSPDAASDRSLQQG